MQLQSQVQTKANKASSAGAEFLQRACACGQHSGTGGECEACKKKRMSLQRQAASPAALDVAPPIVHEVLRSPGQPLDASTRAFMEPRFGHDFSRVRVHTDARAAESAQAVNALAYTVGGHIAFGMGQYAPSTSEGRWILAHELTHALQQGTQTVTHATEIGTNRSDSYEQEADSVASVVGAGWR
ncbi:MAG TPA: DUF4157 domain-containing protein, partial [Nitrososphaera sp.]|nr:DUF4157 domain-containing protein [Nitrososphaera sp.]